MVGDKVLLSTVGIHAPSVRNLGAHKMAPRCIGPFTVLRTHDNVYVFAIPTTMRLHPTFYVVRVKRYLPTTVPRCGG